MFAKSFFSFLLLPVESIIARYRALTTEVPVAKFKRLHMVNDRINGNVMRVGNLRRGAADRRPILNQDGTYIFMTKTNGTPVNLKIVAQRGAEPKVEIPVHGETVLVPLSQIARSVKTDENGALIRAQ